MHALYLLCKLLSIKPKQNIPTNHYYLSSRKVKRSNSGEFAIDKSVANLNRIL